LSNKRIDSAITYTTYGQTTNKNRKIVSLAQHKTNRDYLNAVRERVHLYSSMRQLTNSFELHWYGFQPPAESDWNEFRAGYQKALRPGSGQ